ncbi:MAG: hypothetical protein IPK53_04985 [bacterium]|nr:hypothetical protein [bacterium]
MDSFNLRTSSGIVPIRFARAEAAWIAAEIAESFGARRPRVLLVTDENVALHHLQSVAGALTGQGFDVTPAVIAPEKSRRSGHVPKSYWTFSRRSGLRGMTSSLPLAEAW